MKLCFLLTCLWWITNTINSFSLRNRAGDVLSARRFELCSIFRNGKRVVKKAIPSIESLSSSSIPQQKSDLTTSPTVPAHPTSIDEIVATVANQANCIIKSISLNKYRYNIVLAKGIRGDDNSTLIEDTWNTPTSDEITEIHRRIYQSIEQVPILQPLLEFTEFLISSPGISDRLLTDRDFVSFQGFPVIIRLNDVFRKKIEFHGTLSGRDAEFVRLSLKGRKIEIPRHLVEEVILPASGFEDGEDLDISII